MNCFHNQIWLIYLGEHLFLWKQYAPALENKAKRKQFVLSSELNLSDSAIFIGNYSHKAFRDCFGRDLWLLVAAQKDPYLLWIPLL